MAQVITSQEFDSKVLQANGPVLVDFFATWCGPCKMLAPVLDEVANEVAGKAAVYKVDIDQSLEGGQVKRTAMGAQPKANVLALLD